MLVLVPSGFHKVEEGHVGVYFRGGALLTAVTQPGYHVMFPFLTRFENVQTTVQTDRVTNIPCGTSGGVLIEFESVEVVNRLRADMVYDTVKNYTTSYDRTWIFDKIHHEINQFCSSHTLQEVYIDLFDTLDENLAKALQRDCDVWAPGIQIIAIRVTKPRIPEAIRKNYEMMEAEKTKLLIATQHQKVVEKEAETTKRRATIEAQQQAEVSRISMEREINEMESRKKIAFIDDQMHLDTAKAHADSEFYRVMREAEANKIKLSPEYLQYVSMQSIGTNTKLYFGPSIPQFYSENSLSGVPSAAQMAAVDSNKPNFPKP
eukprot:GILJ01002676.1.p1 GENE.GILJ01002676.1~~GILJ01002676.1.p1  ORF type:complete len:344 (-),score=57.07 GILJ01002676.1:169-1125(-)